MSSWKSIIRKIIPASVKSKLWDIYISFLIKYMPFRYKYILKKIKKKDQIKIAFLVQLASSWKYDYIFNLFLDNPRYEVIIIICPISSYDNDAMFKEMQRAFDFFSRLNYTVFSTWDKGSQQWIDIKETFNPDIVFFSNPWAELSRPEYYIFNFLNTLSCYAPYGFKTSHLYEAIFNKPFQNLLWKIFYETTMHKDFAFKYARNKGKNGSVTGYPGMDNLLDRSYAPEDVWKTRENRIKRIIWAPHHTILGKSDSNVGFSTFLLYSEFMLQIAKEFKTKIQISFKPHPLLRPKMNNHSDWGKDKTDRYFNTWSTLPYTQLNEGNYIDLFLTSDALINDGESFMVEYLYTQKPAMFLVADDEVSQRFNEFGKMTFEQLYQGYSGKDILAFIDDVVIKGNDHKKEKRVEFFENQVKPPYDRLASENIYNIINSAVS